MIPALDARGLLPPGIFTATFADVEVTFAHNVHREKIWAGLMFVAPVLRSIFTGNNCALRPLILGGSYFSDKVAPEDIECTVRLDAATPAIVLGLFQLAHYHTHAAWKKDRLVDYWPSMPGQNDFGEFFQYVGAKTAAAKGLQTMDKRGI
jgi:hypothetical protein